MEKSVELFCILGIELENLPEYLLVHKMYEELEGDLFEDLREMKQTEKPDEL